MVLLLLNSLHFCYALCDDVKQIMSTAISGRIQGQGLKVDSIDAFMSKRNKGKSSKTESCLRMLLAFLKTQGHMNNNIFQHLAFCHPWRPEQQRVLNHLQEYLDDKRIHIVAAPGAGKTVIGLEIFKRLQLKTLAIAPTTVVRNQWLDRLNNFLPEGEQNPDWAGTTLQQPLTFTTATYQGLFSFDKKLSTDDIDAQYESLSHWFIEHQIGLLILDEAHHLKAAWWKVLMKLVNTSDTLIIASLTATPPYDASPVEWSRYQKLCGPIDEEISIPELVRSNSLCPHQDYIWMVATDDKNISSLNRQKKNLNTFIHSLENHTELLYLLQLHHWLDEQRKLSTKDILINLDECFALLGLLQLQHEPLPTHLLTVLQTKAEDIAPIDVFGWEVLLQSFLNGDHYPSAKPINTFKETLASLLKSKHFLRYNRVSLDNSKKKLAAFSKTQERIKACFDIANVEYCFREDWMRLVILSDFIRDEKYQLALDGLEAPTGAYPIFHYFIHHLAAELANKTVLLTGRLSIIHQDLMGLLSDHLPPSLALSTIPYSENTNYIVLKVASEHLSAAFTALHKAGEVLILIGTRSLLGEGWDAPHVNALILATQTGAYVTTNQIRGRAIRIDTEDELKTASIWHIVAVAPNQPYNKLILQDLHKRFNTFAGIHASELSIESGIERLALSVDDRERANQTSESSTETPKSIIEQSNQATIQRLQDDIYNLQARWQNALEKVEHHVFQAGLHVDVAQSKRWKKLAHYVATVDNKFKNYKKPNRKYLRLGALIITYVATLLIGFIATQSLTLHSDVVLITLAGVTALFAWLTWGALRNKQQSDEKDEAYYAKHYITRMADVMILALNKVNRPTINNISELPLDMIYHDDFSIERIAHTAVKNGTMNTREIFEGVEILLGMGWDNTFASHYLLIVTDYFDHRYVFPIPTIKGTKKVERRKNAEDFKHLWQQHFPEFKTIKLVDAKTKEGKYYLSTILTEEEKESRTYTSNTIRFSVHYRTLLIDHAKTAVVSEVSEKAQLLDAMSYPLKFSKALLLALKKINVISHKEDEDEKNAISIIEVKSGYLRFSLNEYSRKENDIFLTALSQLLEPIRQPRYLLVLNNKPNSDDILAVPSILGNKKANAETFLWAWKHYFPEHKQAKVIATTIEKGQHYLLSAKVADHQTPEKIDLRLIDRWE